MVSAQKLVLGSVQFGMPYGIQRNPRIMHEEACRVLSLAAEYQIDTLDTAAAYGASEHVLGECDISNFLVMTKLLPLQDKFNAYRQARKSIENSLRILKINTFEAVLVHNLEDLFVDGVWRALEDCKSEGVIRKIGVSVYCPEDIERVLEYARVDVIQAPFNLIDRRLLTSGWLDRLYEMGVEIHVRSVFLQGLLLIPKDEIPVYFKPWLSHLKKWWEWIEAQDASAVGTCLNYVASHERITKILFGVDSLRHLQQIVTGLNLSQSNFPDIGHDDEGLIVPGKWSKV